MIANLCLVTACILLAFGDEAPHDGNASRSLFNGHDFAWRTDPGIDRNLTASCSLCGTEISSALALQAAI